MTSTLKKRITLSAFFALCLGSLGFWWFSHSYSQFKIEPFVYERDMPDIKELFDANWYWLMGSPKEAYSPNYLTYVFKFRTPGANPMKHNTLQIHVIRDNNHVAGFTAFFKKTATIGQILFVAVHNAYRNKGLGDKLFRYAKNELIKQGSTQLILLTRTDNERAQRLYKRNGFSEAYSDAPGFIYFSSAV